MRIETPVSKDMASYAVYVDGVLATNVTQAVPGPKGFVVIELADEEASEKVIRYGKVEVFTLTPGTPPQEYAGLAQ